MKGRTDSNKYIETAGPVLQRLESAGFEAYLVGGCVREALRGELGKKDTDIDVTTNALPEETCRVFEDLQVIETGIKHGTVTVLVPSGEDRIPIEITTYRVDGAYSDGRHPDEVRFVTSLTEDLRRRDFTVNAMAMDLRGQLVDPFGGRQDLKHGIIRAVGDPEMRFREDGLRILRALRFAAVLTGPAPAEQEGEDPLCAPEKEPFAFQIEPATAEALFRCAPLLEGISAVRIFTELKKLVCGEGAGPVVRRYVDILTVVIPELAPMKGFAQNNPYHNYDVLEHCIRAMETVRPATDPVMRLAALFHDIGKPEVYTQDENGIGHFYGHPQVGAKMVRRILQRLKTDRATMDRIEILVCYHDLVFQEDDRLLRRWMNRYTPEILLQILEIKRADNIATGNVSQELLDKFERIRLQILEILQSETCFCIRDLAVNGRDLIGEGIPRGPEIGRTLNELLEAVIDGDLPNEREALLARARRSRG